MSTYNLAFVVSDFFSITNLENGHSINARSNVAQHANFALQIENKLFKKYEEIMNIPYKMSKMDLVAIPFFKYDAMENWGAIFFK